MLVSGRGEWGRDKPAGRDRSFLVLADPYCEDREAYDNKKDADCYGELTTTCEEYNFDTNPILGAIFYDGDVIYRFCMGPKKWPAVDNKLCLCKTDFQFDRDGRCVSRKECVVRGTRVLLDGCVRVTCLPEVGPVCLLRWVVPPRPDLLGGRDLPGDLLGRAQEPTPPLRLVPDRGVRVRERRGEELAGPVRRPERL
jgi:hypothetical protein